MNFKNCIFSGFLVLVFALSIHAKDAFDELLDLVDTPEITNAIINSEIITTRQASKQSILLTLIDWEIPALLQENIFLRSNKLNSRSLLDYPEFFPFGHDHDQRAIYLNLFYNQTSRLNFTKDSTNICSYLGIFEPSFITKLQKTISIIKDNIPIEPEQATHILQLLQTFTVQERRLGLMIGGKTTFGCWNFHIMAPWYYLERNHFVDKKIEDAIEALTTELLERIVGASQLTPAQQALAQKRRDAFIDQHLIADKFGIGDTRIYIDRPFIKRKFLSSRIGVLATIPTAFAMKSGLKGAHLRLVKNRPLLDFVEVFEAGMSKQISPAALNYGVAFLDNLGAMLLDAPLGNGGHFGLGIFLRNKSPLTSLVKLDWARNFTMRSFASLEYLFPAVEWRSARVPVNEALFNQRNFSPSETDQLIINSNYRFLVEQLTDRLFPVALQARVHPGIVFRWSSQFCYEYNNKGFTLGTDTYVRNREALTNLNADPATKKIIDIFNAHAPLSYQSKVVGSFFFKIPKCDREFMIGLWGDYTFMNKGIGADFSLVFKCDVTF